MNEREDTAPHIRKAKALKIGPDFGDMLAVIEYGSLNCGLNKTAAAIDMESASKSGDFTAEEKIKVLGQKNARLAAIQAEAASGKTSQKAICAMLPNRYPGLFVYK